MWLCFDNDLWNHLVSWFSDVCTNLWLKRWCFTCITLYKLQWFCCKAKCCDHQILKTSMVSYWLTHQESVYESQQWWPFKNDSCCNECWKLCIALCIMVVPSMHCSMNCFFKWSPFLRFISWFLMSVIHCNAIYFLVHKRSVKCSKWSITWLSLML